MRMLRMLFVATLVVSVSPAFGKDMTVGDKFYQSGSETSMLLACHPSESAFTVGGSAFAGFSAVAWTLKIKVGDTFVAPTVGRKSNYTLRGMAGCTGFFEEVPVK